MKTKSFALFLPLFALASCGGGQPSSSASSRLVFTDETGMSYEQYEDGWHITDYRGEDKNVIVPETKTIGGLTLKVTQIEANAFYGRSSLEGVELPSSIVTIGDSAFYGTGLSSFYGSVNLKQVANNAFDKTPFLESETGPILYLPTRDNPHCIAYKQLSTVSNYEVPQTMERALPEVFARASFKEGNPTFPSLKHVGERAFANANFEYTITLDAATEIGTEAFINVPATAVTMPSVESLGDHAFQNASFLTTIKISKNLESMGQGVFDGCYAVKTVNLPFIGPNRNEAKDLTYVFGDASSLKADSTLNNFKVVFDTLEINGGILADDISKGKTYGFKNLIIDNVWDVPACGFQDHDEMTSLILNDVKNIQTYAFYRHKLSSVYISLKVQNVYDFAFASSVAYEINYEGTSTNASKLDLDAINVGRNVTFHYGVANPCTSTEKISADGNWKYALDEDRYSVLISYLGSDPEITIPRTMDGHVVTVVQDTLFKDNHVVTSLTVPENTPTLVDHAFAGAHNLKKLVLYKAGYQLAKLFSPDEFEGSYSVIRAYGFSSADTETTYIPSSLEEINFHYEGLQKYDCANFTSLKKVTFPEDGVYAREDAFYGCSSVVEVYIPKGSSCESRGFGFGEDTIVKVHNSNSVSSWDKNFAYWTESKHVIKVDDSGESIDFIFTINSKKGFATLTAYQGDGGEVTIPSTYNGYPVTTIGGLAFRQFGDKITSLIFPNSITEFETTCLVGCRNLEKLVIPFCGLTQKSSNYQDDYMFTSLFGGSDDWDGNAEGGLYQNGLPTSLKRIRVTDQTSFKTKSFYGVQGLDDLILPEETTSISGDFISNGTGIVKRLYIGDKLTTTLGNSIPGHDRNITLYTGLSEGELNLKTYIWTNPGEAFDLFMYPPVYDCSLEDYLTLFPW